MRDPDALEIRIVERDCHDLIALVEALDAELEERYPHHLTCGIPSSDGDLLLLVGYVEGEPVGCGALREIAPGSGELKRLFVAPRGRRRGVGRRLLGAVEAQALARGYHLMRLESGVRQPEALALYESCGYRRIPNFGEYEEGPLSVCFEKRLA